MEESTSFECLSPEDKRREIARDVLKHIKNKRVLPASGHFLQFARAGMQLLAREDPDNEEGERFTPADLETPFKDALGDRPCTACALGSLMYARFQRSTTTLKDFGKHAGNLNRLSTNGDQIIESLSDVFSRQELRLIECAFEKGQGAYSPQTAEMRLAANLYREVSSPARRIKLICENIIKNGCFKLERYDLERYDTHD